MLIQNPPAQVAEGLWLLGSYEYPLYLFRDGSEAALFEGGTGPMGPLVCEQLEGLAVGRELIKQLVIPHAHPDHVMAVPLLRESLPGVAVLASQSAAKTLSVEKAVAFFCQIDDAITQSLLAEGRIAEQHRRPPLAEKCIRVDKTIREGDSVAVGNVAFQVLETGGHSDCSLSFYQPDRGILLVSDAPGYYMHDYQYWWPNYFCGYPAYLASIERLRGLKAEILCLGHHGAVLGAEHVESFLGEAIAATQQYHQRIVTEARAGKTLRQIAEQLGSEVHQKTHLMPLDFFQKNCGLLVKQSLKHEGITEP